MKFICLGKTTGQETKDHLLAAACQKYDLDFHFLRPQDVNLLSQISFDQQDLYYRTAITKQAGVAEAELQVMAQGPTSFYSHYQTYLTKYYRAAFYYQQEAIPCPKTAINPYHLQPQALSELAEALGGFPLIVKAVGYSKGVGVMKVESLESLLSITQFLQSHHIKYNLRQYIDVGKPAYSLRAVVLGDKVIFSYKNQSVNINDFRSNTNQEARTRTKIDLNPEEEKLIVASVQSLGLELGGVDFVRDDQDEIKIFEVNFPFNFAPIVTSLKFPLHEKMVTYLIEKAQNND